MDTQSPTLHPDGDTPPRAESPASTEAGSAHEDTHLELDALRAMLGLPPDPHAPKPRDGHDNPITPK